MPRRTLSPRISTTVTVMSLLMTMLSFFFLDSTNIAAYPSESPRCGSGGLIPTHHFFPPLRGEKRGLFGAPMKTHFIRRNQRESLGRRPARVFGVIALGGLSIPTSERDFINSHCIRPL